MHNPVAKPFDRVGELLARTTLSARSLLAAGALLSLLLAIAGQAVAALVSLTLTLAWVVAVIVWRKGVDPGALGGGGGSPRGSPVTAREASLNALLSALPDAALALDSAGRVVAGNSAATALFPSAAGRQLALVIREPELLAAVEEASSTGTTRDIQCRLPPPIDQTLAARVAPLASVMPGTDAAIVVLLRDVSEQERLSRMRADFVANASHELRTPLASLKGFIETLQGAAKDDVAAREQFLAIMHEQASRMARLIDDLLSLSRIEMREHVPPQGSADLIAIVDEVCKVLRPLAEKAGIRLETAELVGPGAVIGDKDELVQVVHNLVQNAIKYGRGGGKVAISLSREAGRLVLRVADDGIGIAPEHLPRLTERFYRVNAKESRERGGTGLGLAIVKHIVSRHRGQLRIESQPGRGSTFAVSLNAEPRAQIGKTDRDDSDASASRRSG